VDVVAELAMATADKTCALEGRPGRIHRGSDVSDAFRGSLRTMLLADLRALFDETG
jgi:hypothetical protein